MHGVYIVTKEISSLATAKTILLGTNGSGKVIEILEARLTNGAQNTVEQIIIALSRVTTLGSPTGSSANVQKAESGSPSTTVTWLSDLTAEPTAYADEHLDIEGVVNVAGYRHEPMPEARRYIPPSASFGLRLLASPTNAITKAEALIVYRELG